MTALAVAAGAVDAVSYLGLGQVFTANMTGNTVLLGIAIARGQGGAAVRSGVALAGFCAGVAMGAVCTTRTGRWPAGVRRLLLAEALALAGLWAGWTAAGVPPADVPRFALIAASAIAMGLQSEATRASGQGGVSTTYLTGTLTRAVERATSRERGSADESPRLPAWIWVVYLGGAIAGGAAELAWHQPAVAIPLALALAVALAG